MELVDRYVYAVGRHLPRRGRADIETEIRSLIEDTLDGYAQKQGRNVDEEMVVAVLQEFGKPEEVAASYRSGKQYLVGPELFPIFKLVLTVVISVMSAFYLIGILIALGRAEDFWNTLLTIFSGRLPEYFSTMIGILGIIVIVFAVLERVLPEQAFVDDEDWDPTQLEKVEEPNRINRAGLIISIVFLVIFLIWFNFFPRFVGIYVFADKDSGFISVLVDGYQALMPWINLWWIASILLKVLTLRQGRWTTVTRLGEIGVNLIGLFVIYQIFSGTPFFGVNSEWSSGSAEWAVGLFESLRPLAALLTKFVLGIVLIASVIEIIGQVYKLITDPPAPVWRVS
ncbi:MAG: hypothetical protein R3293_08490 [Candidatus Promineifilaceae bacterium]|nr:hypothetical protein [Candidatus Promineifilaceae bacterium]